MKKKKDLLRPTCDNVSLLQQRLSLAEAKLREHTKAGEDTDRKLRNSQLELERSESQVDRLSCQVRELQRTAGSDEHAQGLP